jgi:hypothetical protein
VEHPDIAVQVVDDHPAVPRGLKDALEGARLHFLDPVSRAEDVTIEASVVVLDLHLAAGGLLRASRSRIYLK